MSALPLQQLEFAAQAIKAADALVFSAGAGIGVDSGLADFRGNEGFWRAYPQFKQLGKSFSEMANPQWFVEQPKLAWGFYGHRYNLYRQCLPHHGFELMKGWVKSKDDYFVFTSNVDGQFQKAGFNELNIFECHGSITHFQCTRPCCNAIWQASELIFDVDDDMLCRSMLPRCPHCDDVARPNILMFGDVSWVSDRADIQQVRYMQFLKKYQNKKVVVVECGAGLAVPTVRFESESIRGQLVRINPNDDSAPVGGICLRLGAKEAIELIDQQI